MAVERHFLGWDAPVVRKVRGYLIPTTPKGPVDLRTVLVVVPTQHAGRRLREALALLCNEHGTYLLPPRVITPPSLISPCTADATQESLDASAVWTRLLLDIDPGDYPGLFPKPPSRTFAWALSTARLVQSLRDELLEHGRTIGDVVTAHSHELEEVRRWEDMARLEREYVANYRAVTGEQEPGERGLLAASSPVPPEGIDRILLACVADPAPLALKALSVLSRDIPIEALIHAPQDYADAFDEWGRPSATAWCDETIEAPDAALVLAGSPATESACALQHIRERGGDVAVGILDTEVAPYLEADLEAAGFAAFDPNGVSLSTTPLLHLLRAYRDLGGEGSYRSLATLLRNADVLDHLSASSGLRADRLLQELDRYQNHYLPATAGSVLERLRLGALTSELPAGTLSSLREAAETLARLFPTSPRESGETRIRQFLQTVFTHRELKFGAPDDDAFRAAAELVDEALRSSASSSLHALGFSDTEMLDVLLDQLGSMRFVPPRPRNAIDLEGWLELAWNDAPFVVVTGMNEGKTPARLHNETFLPESLRKALGLRTNESRYARDVYLTRSLIASRQATGGVALISAKATVAGDPLYPSRILFRCADSELPGRASRLFGPPVDTRSSIPSTVSFRFRADAPLHLAAPAIPHTSVVGLRDYLQCPFRFYLKHVLGMEPLDDRKRELDPLDFGSLVHHVMNAMAADTVIRDCDDARRVQDYLASQLDDWITARLGAAVPLNISIQLNEARERLAVAARTHAGAAAEGWRILAHEQSFEGAIGGLVVRGRIDRIDRHEPTGAIRVLDYKASDRARTPEKAHLGPWRDDALPYARLTRDGKSKRWTDLQLPLYALLLPEEFRGTASVAVGYFNLPSDPGEAGIAMWDGFDSDVASSAYACAEAAAKAILAGIFWPPAARVEHDDFGSVFPGGAGEGTIDPGLLMPAGQRQAE